MIAKRKLGLGLALVVIGAGGVFGIASASGDPDASSPPEALPDPPTTLTVRNGVTFGSALGVMSDAEVPDFVLTIATNGKVGYVKKADFLAPSLKGLTPEIIKRDYVVRTFPDGRTGYVNPKKRAPVPVYAIDGETVIGEFAFTEPG